MNLLAPDMIPKIDEFAINVLNIPERELMRRSGEAVALAVREATEKGSLVVILAGKGNNGGDGYAAGALLADNYRVTVIDVFSAGQRSESGKFWLGEAKGSGVNIIPYSLDTISIIKTADCIVDAVFGTGFDGDIPASLLPVIDAVSSSAAYKVAVDIPLGINARDGSVKKAHIRADTTVSLSYVKPGLLSYPAKEFVGKIVLCDLSLPQDKIEKKIGFDSFYTDKALDAGLLPERRANSNKGSFGRTMLIVGSEKYFGAAHLALEAALRGGCGIVEFVARNELCIELRQKFPEAIYTPLDIENEENVNIVLQKAEKMSSILIGCGSSVSKGISKLTEMMIKESDSQIIIDADGLNSIAEYSDPSIFSLAKKRPILTPHPLEFSRISGVSTDEIQGNRIGYAKAFAKKYNVILLLKGAGTIITDGKLLYINGSGSSALSKGGSGDVLAGLIASMTAFAQSPIEAVALSAYLHGRAGDELEEELSSFGVTPSDLPKKIAGLIAELEKN